MKIAFIGLGNMGAPMALNLTKAGHRVIGYDLTAKPDGLTLAQSVSAAAEGAEVAITMLPNGVILREVGQELISALPAGAIWIDCSTVDVQSAREVAQAAAIKGISALDAPVSGGIGGAAAGSLTFMVGGATETLTEVASLFDIMGQKTVHCGPSGNGQAAKACNNMILGVTMIATCEAFVLAQKLGLSAQSLYDVVSTSSGYSWSMNAYCPAPGVGPQSPADRDYQPGFAAELMLKDLNLSQQAAAGSDAATPMGQLAAKLYEEFVENHEGRGKDFSAMLPHLAQLSRT